MLTQGIYYESKLHPFARDFHSIYRFGHTSNFHSRVELQNGRSDDYLSGVMMASCMILFPGMIWIITLIILKFLDHRVGCASGRPITIPAEDGNNDCKSFQSVEDSFVSDYCDLTVERQAARGLKCNIHGQSDDFDYFVLPTDHKRVNRSHLSFIAAGLLTLVGSVSFIIAMSLSISNISDVYQKIKVIQNTIPDATMSTNRIVNDLSEQIQNGITIINEHLNGGLCEINSYATRQVNQKNAMTITSQYNSSILALQSGLDTNEWSEFKKMLHESDLILSNFGDLLKHGKSHSVPSYVSSVVFCIVLILTTLFLMRTARIAKSKGYDSIDDTSDQDLNKKKVIDKTGDNVAHNVSCDFVVRNRSSYIN